MARTTNLYPGIYNSTAFALSDGEGSSLSTDAAGRLITNPGGYTTYESKSFSIGAETDYDVKASETLFATTKRCVMLKANQICTAKFNSSSNNAFTFAANEQITIEGMDITNIYLTTTEVATAFRIISFA